MKQVDFKGVAVMSLFLMVQIMYFHINHLTVPYFVDRISSNKYDLKL